MIIDNVNHCKHLDDNTKASFLQLFAKHSELFSGALGRVPGLLIKLKLKKDAIPFHSRAYTVPKAIERMAKRKWLI